MRQPHLAVLLVLLSGCKDNPVIAEVGALADKMCTCKDTACIEAARAETVEYQKTHAKTVVSKDDNKQVDAHMQRAKACMDALTKPPEAAPTEPVPAVAPLPPAEPRPPEAEQGLPK